MSEPQLPDERLEALLQQLAGAGLSSDGWQQLNEMLLVSAEARRQYLRFQYLHARLTTLAWEPAEHLPLATDQAMEGPSDPADAEFEQLIRKFHALEAGAWQPSPALSARSDGEISSPAFPSPHSRPPRLRFLALAATLLVAVGIVAYVLWPRHAAQPVAEKPAGEPAAKVTSSTDAQWLGPLLPKDGAIADGERLVLERGSVEITFSRQARMIIEAPTDVVIVDGGTCRLASGKLTAHVPAQAKGFQVHTPGGTVTDQGTEFGVYVKTSSEIEELPGEQEQPAAGGPQQAAKLPPVTEVHVFQGKVDVTRSEVDGHRSAAVVGKSDNDAIAQDPISDLRPPISQILSAGQAVTISDSKVQPLSAADPFKFALDKLQGRPRHVLLTEDFEAYDLSRQVKSLGPWVVQSGTRKGQGVSVEDPAQSIAAANAEVDVAIQLPAPPALVGGRVANFGTSAQNSTDTYPVLGREINGKLLAKKCQVLVEFDFFPRSDEPQLSLALATEVGHTAGIELWRSVDAAKQGVDAARKIDFVAYRWYRMRVLLSVAGGVVSEVRVDRSQWRGAEGWVRDLSYQPPMPKLDWSTPPRYAIFGFPVVSPATVGGVFWLDNVRIEVIAEN